ncbi:hypothetical protein BST61_g11322 [Cercospora zeina]
MFQLWKHGFRGKALVWAVTAAACQAFLLLGFDQGVMAGIIGADNPFGGYFNNPDADMQGNITALTMLLAGGSIMIVGAVVLGTSINVAQLIAGRIITGVGNGMNSSTAPVYLSECAPSSYRGMLLTLQGTLTILGVVIAYWMDYGTSFSSTSFQWRFPLSFQAAFAILLVLQIIGLPESPRWLVQHDRYEEAAQVTAHLLSKDAHDADVERVILNIRVGLEEEQKGGPFRFKELFTWAGAAVHWVQHVLDNGLYIPHRIRISL